MRCLLAVLTVAFSAGCPSPGPGVDGGAGGAQAGGSTGGGFSAGGGTAGGSDGGGAAGGGSAGGINAAGYGYEARLPNPTCLAPPPPPSASGVRVVRAFPNITLANPMLLLQAPGDASRIVVIERAGRVRAFPNNDAAMPNQVTTVMDISSRVSTAGEGGLLGIAFHPQWATRKEMFLSYTRPGSGGIPLISVIARFRSTDNGATFDPSSEERLLQIDQPFDNHDGGMIAFGPDGFLYIGFGDGGSGNDPNNAGQQTNTNLGKFLRIDVDVPFSQANGSYAIPSTNPYSDAGVACNLTSQRRQTDGGTAVTRCSEIYAVGLRNPWRWSFDLGTGALWAGDVGQGAYEEIDIINNGGNYGWKDCEGFHLRGSTSACNRPGFVSPVFDYPRTSPDGGPTGNSVTGGYVYRGTAVPQLIGRYLFGDYGNGNIYALRDDPSTGAQFIGSIGQGLGSFGQTLDGEVYALQLFNGTVHRLQSISGADAGTAFPERLSQTGCFTSTLPTQPVASLIPFDVNAALWSDGALKDRAFAIPDGTRITLLADGDFDFPNGTVTVKTFSLGGRKIETRLLVKHTDGTWAGYSYEWRNDQTDADLLPSSKSKAVGSQTWFFPSRAQCMTCHTTVAGKTLGLELAQLNKPLTYPTGRTANQVETLAGLGYLSAPLPGTIPKLASPNDMSASLESRARSYLHANCSNCHRNGAGQGPQDFRFSLSLRDARLCGVSPTNGNAGVAGALLMTPANPSLSLISIRTKALNINRMPPLGSSVVDAEGTALIDAWINSVTACP